MKSVHIYPRLQKNLGIHWFLQPGSKDLRESASADGWLWPLRFCPSGPKNCLSAHFLSSKSLKSEALKVNQYHKFLANCMEDLQDLRWLVYVRLFVPRFIGCLVCPSFMYILLMSATEASKASAKAGSTFCLHFTALSITAWCAS